MNGNKYQEGDLVGMSDIKYVGKTNLINTLSETVHCILRCITRSSPMTHMHGDLRIAFRGGRRDEGGDERGDDNGP